MKKCKICGLEYEEEKCPNCSREITDPLVLIARQNIINKRRRNKIALLVCSVLLVVFLFLFTAAYIIGHIDYSPSSSSRSTSTLSPSSTSTPIPETSDTTNSTSYPSYSEPEIPEDDAILAVDLFGEYEANEIAADNKYNGERIKIKGTIKDIGRDIWGDAYITLKAKESEYSLAAVQCYFKNENEIVGLVKGQDITLIGNIDGLIMNLIVKDCALQENQ